MTRRKSLSVRGAVGRTVCCLLTIVAVTAACQSRARAEAQSAGEVDDLKGPKLRSAENDGIRIRIAEMGQGPPVKLLPYPQSLQQHDGKLPLGPARCTTEGASSPTEQVAMDSLNRFLPRQGEPIAVRLGSLEESFVTEWLDTDERAFLAKETTSPEAYVLTVRPDGITVVGKGKWGMLHGVQTINQLVLETTREKRSALGCLTVRDWPDMEWRCLAPALTWYSGFNRLEGYDLCNWSLDEWKWLVDWSLLHKCNAWAVVMCGYWPFTLPGYEESTLDVDSFFFDPATGKKTPRRFVHPNIKREFFPEVIRYAQQRGIKVHAYTAINSFVGGYILHHPEAKAGGAAEMLPFHPGVHEYVDAFLGRMVEMGFDGFVWENPEAYHVPNQNEQCYKTFWEPWAETYGFGSVEETGLKKPPLGVHVEYLAWLFNEYNDSVQRHAKRLGLASRETWLISHFLLKRIVDESESTEERKKWLDLLDEKHGRKVPWIVNETREQDYVDLLGGDRVFSLGGRGGACTSAMRRIASVNNNCRPDSMGTGVDFERDCQRRIYEAGGHGGMGYILEWRLNEIFGYIAAAHLWRNAGVPGINNEDQVAFLDYAYRLFYGDDVGALVARTLDGGSNVNDAMVLEGVHGAQYPETGQLLHRDYQLLAVNADQAVELAWRAFRQFTDTEPDLERPLYRSEDFRWNGFDPEADHLFKAETLRRLCVSTRRSQELCEAALAHRLATRLSAEGASLKEVLKQLDMAVEAAEENQRLYQINYDDDYDWTDGLCVRLTEMLRAIREQVLLAGASRSGHIEKAWTFDTPGDLLGWAHAHHLSAPVIAKGELKVEATGPDPFLVQVQPLSVPVSPRHLFEIEIASDRAGRAELFWTTAPGEPRLFLEEPYSFEVKISEEPLTYFFTPADRNGPWEGTLNGLRLDTPGIAGSHVRIRAMRIRKRPQGDPRAGADLAQPVPETLRGLAGGRTLFIPWEKQTDIVPTRPTADAPGLFVSVDLGLTANRSFACHGVVFTVQSQEETGEWRTLFRRTVGKNSRQWEHWDIPIASVAGAEQQTLRLRFLTDSYSRAQDQPFWQEMFTQRQWALWGRPQLVKTSSNGDRRVLYDFIDHIAESRPFVRLDVDGKDRPFDGKGADRTGATFQTKSTDPKVVPPQPAKPCINAFTPHVGAGFGMTGADFDVLVGGSR